MPRSRHAILAAVLLAGGLLAGVAHAGVSLSISYVPGPFHRSGGRSANAPSVASGVRRQVSAAQSDLSRAYAEAAKNDVLGEEIKAAQDALAAARQAHAQSLVIARDYIGQDAYVSKLRGDVRSAEVRIRDEKSAAVRLVIAKELMTARNLLNAAEGEVLDIDPDLAIAKANVAKANDALKDLQARRQRQVHQDPAVLAARARLDGLRRQLAGR